MTITKKNVRKAVRRNHIKRIIREAFRTRKNQLTGLDIVVLTSYSINELTRQEQAITLGSLFDRLIKRTKSGIKDSSPKSDE